MDDPQVVTTVSAPDRISPGQVEMAEDCPLQLALNATIPENSRSLPSSSPARYVGTAFHGVIESARRGDGGNPPSRVQLEEIWSQQIAKVEDQARDNGDACWLPLSRSYGLLERVRLSAVQLALSQRVYGNAGQSGEIGTTETRLESSDGLVAGRIDAIDRSDGSIVLQDFKSGVVADPSGQPIGAHTTQMLLYAALHHEVCGIWPSRLELVDRTGRVLEVSFTPDDAMRALDSAKALLRGVVSVIGTGKSLSDSEVGGLARPTLDTCRFCRHRPVCARYLADLGAEGTKVQGRSRFSPVDAIGTVTAAGSMRGNRAWITFEHAGTTRTIRGCTRHGRYIDADGTQAATALPGAGTRIAVFNGHPRRSLESFPEATMLVAGPNVRVYTLMEDGE